MHSVGLVRETVAATETRGRRIDNALTTRSNAHRATLFRLSDRRDLVYHVVQLVVQIAIRVVKRHGEKEIGAVLIHRETVVLHRPMEGDRHVTLVCPVNDILERIRRLAVIIEFAEIGRLRVNERTAIARNGDGCAKPALCDVRDLPGARIAGPERVVCQNVQRRRRFVLYEFIAVALERLRNPDGDLRRIELIDDVDKCLFGIRILGRSVAEGFAVGGNLNGAARAADAHRRDPPRTAISRPERIVRQHFELMRHAVRRNGVIIKRQRRLHTYTAPAP